MEIETVSRNSNLRLIETVRDSLGGVGLKTHLTFEARKTKANLFATIPAVDERVDGGIVFSGSYGCRSGGRPGLTHRPLPRGDHG